MALESQAFHFAPDIEKQLGFTQVVKANGVLYLSGMISVDSELKVVGPGDAGAQLTNTFGIIKAILAQQGMSLKHVVKETIFTTDLQAVVAANEARMEAYRSDDAYFPASTMVGVTALFLPDAMLEIDVVAVP